MLKPSIFIEKVRVGKARVHANKVWKVYQKFPFEKWRSWYRNAKCWFVAPISIERFRMFMHFNVASFSIKTYFYETINIFFSRPLDVFL